MALKYFLSKSLKLIYEKHKNFNCYALQIFENNKGKTLYKLSQWQMEKSNCYNGFGHYLLLTEYFNFNGYYTSSTGYKMRKNNKNKFDVIKTIDFLIDLFD